MAKPKAVVIDGILYVPATEAVAGADAVLRTLALQWHTPDSLDDPDALDGLRIVIADDSIEGESFDEFAARLAEELAK